MKTEDIFPPELFIPNIESLHDTWNQQKKWEELNQALCLDIYETLVSVSKDFNSIYDFFASTSRYKSFQNLLYIIADKLNRIAYKLELPSDSFGKRNIDQDIVTIVFQFAGPHKNMYEILEERLRKLTDENIDGNSEQVLTKENVYGYAIITDQKSNINTRIFLNNSQYKVPSSLKNIENQSLSLRNRLMIYHPKYRNGKEWDKAWIPLEALYQQLAHSASKKESSEIIMELLGELFWETCHRNLWLGSEHFSVLTDEILMNALYILMATCNIKPTKVIGPITLTFAALFSERNEFIENFYTYFESIKPLKKIKEEKKLVPSNNDKSLKDKKYKNKNIKPDEIEKIRKNLLDLEENDFSEDFFPYSYMQNPYELLPNENNKNNDASPNKIDKKFNN